MDPIRLGDFLGIIGGKAVAGSNGAIVHDVTTHSRQVGTGSVFFALPGAREDGHDFVADAFHNGAVGAVVARGTSGPELARLGTTIEVDDPLSALQRLAAWWRTVIEAQVVVVTGSWGKTTTKDAIVHLIRPHLSVYGSPGSYNSEFGVPLSLLACPRQCDVAVIELAISDPGEMEAMEAILRPDRVVLTNLGTRWQSRFPSQAQQAQELMLIGRHLDPDGWLLVGQDDPQLHALAGRLLARRLVSNCSADLPRFSVVERDRASRLVEITFPNAAPTTARIQTGSEETLADVELALSAAWLLGVPQEHLLATLESYKPPLTRMEIWRSPQGVTLVRDIATPDPLAMTAAIRAARQNGRRDSRLKVVLAEPLSRWEGRLGAALAPVLLAEGVDAICGLETPFYRALATAASSPRGAGPEIRLFPSPDELRRHLLDDARRGDVVLIQSPSDSSVADLSTGLMEAMAPTRLYLDFLAIEENVATFRRLVGPTVRLMGVVKALAYGTDATQVSTSLQEAGVDFLSVSGADEGVALREAGVRVPILVLLGTGSELGKMLRHGLIPLIYSPELLEAALASSGWATSPVPVHLKVDTGMHRTGFSPAQAHQALIRLQAAAHVRVEGLMTHLASPGDPQEDGFTRLQLSRFQGVVDRAREMGMEKLLCHAANTTAAIRFPEARFDMVRIGIGFYGVHPAPATEGMVHLHPALTLVSRIVEILDLEAGDRVGYGGTYMAPAGGARIGVVPAGYHDGIPRAFSNSGHVIVSGVRCPIVGTISMDSMTVDLSACPRAEVGSDVLIHGRYNDSLIRLEEAAASIGTIPWEVMARTGPRVQRILTRH
jgi:Alr-MurF fusion protein